MYSNNKKYVFQTQIMFLSIMMKKNLLNTPKYYIKKKKKTRNTL